ncbi:MAG TPA: hypothetical protein VG269_26775 [Tepidisphaeraceae bacterium]|jgi:hypothetical protein|nr:hypothetical protein [Tepidisphaeraceae bacterium]
MSRATSGKRALPKNGLAHRKVGFTIGQMTRITNHQKQNEGKSWPDAVRDIFNAGCRSLGLDQPPVQERRVA